MIPQGRQGPWLVATAAIIADRGGGVNGHPHSLSTRIEGEIREVDERTKAPSSSHPPPDIAVTCDEYDIAEAANVIHSPKLIIEVLSPNRGDDLDVKIKQYESRSSIQEYLIIDSQRRWLQRHWREQPLERFTTDPVHIAGSIVLASVDYLLDIDEIYRLVRFVG